jgi:hypothetical protein
MHADQRHSASIKLLDIGRVNMMLGLAKVEERTPTNDGATWSRFRRSVAAA